MADTHEEQLLSDLLSDIAREDARLDARHLESRVVQTADATLCGLARSTHTSFSERRTLYLKTAAAVAVPALVAGTLWLKPEPANETIRQPAVDSAEAVSAEKPVVVPERSAVVSEQPAASVPQRAEAAGSVRVRRHAAIPPAADAPGVESPTAESPPTESPLAFVPLMPITEQELAGSFRIVRVQMPRASLGALRSPLEHPNELVEADLLLGEDGMARAIRVTTGGGVYRWRSR